VQEVDVEPAGAIEWRSAAGVARLTPARPGDVPAVLVLARAGWEGKFVAQALQDAGWRVETDFLVNSSAAGTPARVRSRGPGSLDPGRLAVVVALDESAATRASALATYVRQGGGLLLAPDAALAPALRNISAAVPAVLQEASLGALRSGEPRRGLDRHALRLTADVAVPLEREAGAVRVAARRLDLGRVAVVGYRDTWRWRMEGADGAPEAHAAWWSSLVAAVASPPPVGAVDARDDPAPLPSMYDALGAPLTTAAAARFTSPVTVDALLLSLTCLALLLAWTARRARGLP
jgi:hypothetical protein